MWEPEPSPQTRPPDRHTPSLGQRQAPYRRLPDGRGAAASNVLQCFTACLHACNQGGSPKLWVYVYRRRFPRISVTCVSLPECFLAAPPRGASAAPQFRCQPPPPGTPSRTLPRVSPKFFSPRDTASVTPGRCTPPSECEFCRSCGFRPPGISGEQAPGPVCRANGMRENTVRGRVREGRALNLSRVPNMT